MSEPSSNVGLAPTDLERREIERLNKIIEALMNRAERSMSRQGSDFSLFQTALMLEETVRARTQALEEALHENEKINRDLYRTTIGMQREIRERKRTQQALSESESRYRTVTEAALDAIVTFDQDNIITYVNPTVRTIFGYTQADVLGRHMNKLLPALADDQIDLATYLAHHQSREHRELFELTGRHRNGDEIYLELSFGEFQTSGRRFFTAIARDISERKKSDMLREGEYEILEMIAAGTSLNDVLLAVCRLIDREHAQGMASILLLDDSGKTIERSIAPRLPDVYNQALVGLSIGPSAGSCGTAMFRGRPVVVADIAGHPPWRDYRHLATRYGLASCWSTPVMTPTGEVLGSLAIYHDTIHEPGEAEQKLVARAVHLAGIVIQRSRAEERISYMAHHDALTGLPNRTLLEDRIGQAIALAQRTGTQTAVMLIDLDRFKTVNDSLGHHMGDKLLQQVAGSLRGCLRESDNLARLGGDEFVICLPNIAHAESVIEVARKVIAELNRPFLLDGLELRIGTSIGISLYPTDGDSATELLRTADAAMYSAKRKGRGNFQLFTGALNQAAHQRLELIIELRRALELEQLELFYQPIVSLVNGRIIAAESLLRWRHPDKGLIPPDAFISVLEETGLMVAVGEWVLNAACRQCARWRSAGQAYVPLAVNLSAMQFYQSDIVRTVGRALERHRLPPHMLTLEFTEAVFFEETSDVIEAMHGLKKLGIKLALDDFGTGYSSLSYLQRFPVDRLKIDRSFLPDAEQKPGTANIINSIIRLAQSLNLVSVAEGVETQEQLRLVRNLGCDEVQGYLFSRPLPVAEFERLLIDGLALKN